MSEGKARGEWKEGVRTVEGRCAKTMGSVKTGKGKDAACEERMTMGPELLVNND